MKSIAIVIILFAFCVIGSPAKANTTESTVEKQMMELQACMQKYMHAEGKLPSGENVSVVSKLEKYGFTVPKKYLALDGSYLDYWGTPFYFLATKDGDVIILSLGEKSGDDYPHPFIKIVKLTRKNANQKTK